MKEILLLLALLCFGNIDAQIIDFPDSTFKYILIHGIYPSYHIYDTNHDNEIDMQEAASIINLSFKSLNVHDITGVRNFINLRSLDVQNCGIYNFDLHDMVSLITFNCEYNYNLTTSIDVSGCSNLTSIRCGANPITNIKLTGAYSLQTFAADYNALTQIDFSGLTQLKTISVRYGNLQSINLTGVTNLETFYAYDNEITSLSISNRPNLRYVECDFNRLTNMDLNNNPSLVRVECDGNLLESLTFDGTDNINSLNCRRNNLTTLNIKHLKKIKELDCSKNQIVSLDISNWDDIFPRKVDCSFNKLTSLILNNTNVAYFSCGDNNFTTLDLSNRSKLIKLECQNTPLTYLNITNNNESPLMDSTNNQNINLTENYNLYFICADYWQVGKYENYMNQIGLRAKVGDVCNIQPIFTPNPTRDFVTINAIENITSIYLYNLQGELLTHSNFVLKNNTIVIDFSSYSTGVYFLKMTTESGININPKKIIKL